MDTSIIYKQLFSHEESNVVVNALSLLDKAPPLLDPWLFIECARYGALENFHTLSWAIENGHMEAARLIWSKMDHSAREKELDALSCAFLRVISFGDPARKIAKFLISVAPGRAELYEEMLQMAASMGYIDLVQLIFEHANARGHEIALKCAVSRNQCEVVEFMLKNAAAVPIDEYLLRNAAQSGHAALLRLVIPHVSNYVAVEYDVFTFAAYGGDVPTIEYLLGISRIAGIESVLFKIAAEQCHTELFSYLLDRYDTLWITDTIFWRIVRARLPADAIKILCLIKGVGFRPSYIDHNAIMAARRGCAWRCVMQRVLEFSNAVSVVVRFLDTKEIDLTPLVDGECLNHEQFEMAFRWLGQYRHPVMLEALVRLGLTHGVDDMVDWAKEAGGFEMAEETQKMICRIAHE